MRIKTGEEKLLNGQILEVFQEGSNIWKEPISQPFAEEKIPDKFELLEQKIDDLTSALTEKNII